MYESRNLINITNKQAYGVSEVIAGINFTLSLTSIQLRTINVNYCHYQEEETANPEPMATRMNPTSNG